MKNWHHLQIIVEETQGLSLVRVGFSASICFLATGQSRSQSKQFSGQICPWEQSVSIQGLLHSSQGESGEENKAAKRLGDFTERLRTQAMTKPRGMGLSAPSLKTPKSFPDSPLQQCLSGCPSSSEGCYLSLAKLSSSGAKQGELREAGAVLLPGGDVLSP